MTTLTISMSNNIAMSNIAVARIWTHQYQSTAINGTETGNVNDDLSYQMRRHSPYILLTFQSYIIKLHLKHGVKNTLWSLGDKRIWLCP